MRAPTERDNVEAVKRVYAAFNRRDADEAVEHMSPDFSFRSAFGGAVTL